MTKIMQRKLKCHVCDGDDCDPSVDQPPYICEDALLCWKSTVRETDGKKRGRRGCIVNRDQVPLICNKHLQSGNVTNGNNRNGGGQFHTECCQEELCNGGPFPILQDRTTDGTEMKNVIKVTLAILGPILGLSFIFCAIFLYYRNRRTRRNRSTTPRRSKKLIESRMEPSMLAFSSPISTAGGTMSYSHEFRATAAGDSTLKEYLEGQSLTSGSGSGLPLLVQRTLAKQVALAECLSNGGGGVGGSFGREVWRGIWHGENVAVKIYFSRDEVMWARETEVYSQLLPSRHDNILGYVGSDMTSRASCTQLWLVTHYHPLGSLYNYLIQLPHPLNHHQMFNICLSIANGLLYLHTEIHGTRGKPAMAHRNLKSKNILVKTNGACVIADLAHAVTQDRLGADKMDLKQGSKRYMSPELLEQTFDPQCLEGFRRADIYSLGLVFWEVCRRCISNGVALDYAAPYSEWLVSGNQEPTLEEMRKLVVADQRRPPIPNRWHSDPTLAGMGAMMKECWHTKAAARLPILRVKKTLVKLASNNPDVDLPLD
ncbi:PREDICTED: activin receptor type-1 [Ceratosolen solmsi marchali]|uniref:receptor protein serine/threonine kinase n=1 Tax=Ceratosolen solmsi marchali TaxID=326594 RepID=A0AAJ6VLI3_9HYME|nr:PREDICTED: activin receptor type-1 [Ceratosolen solmsi marchali]